MGDASEMKGWGVCSGAAHQGQRPSTRWTHAPRFRGDERQHPSGAGHTGATQQGFVAAVARETTHWTFVASASTRWPPDHQSGEAEENSCRSTLTAAAAAPPERPINQRDFGERARNAALTRANINKALWVGALLYLPSSGCLGGDLEVDGSANKRDQIRRQTALRNGLVVFTQPWL